MTVWWRGGCGGGGVHSGGGVWWRWWWCGGRAEGQLRKPGRAGGGRRRREEGRDGRGTPPRPKDRPALGGRGEKGSGRALRRRTQGLAGRGRERTKGGRGGSDGDLATLVESKYPFLRARGAPRRSPSAPSAGASGSVFLGVCGADDVARACVFPFEAPRLGLLRRPPPARCPPVCVIGGVQWTPPPTPTLRWGRCQFLRECFVLPRVGTVGPMLKSNQCDVPQSLFRVTAPSCVPPSVDVSLAVRCLKCSDLGSCV